MGYDAMIIVDMQTALVEAGPFNKEHVIENIKSIREACRRNQIPVIYIRHDGGAGDELEKGSAGWEICRELAPGNGEKIFEKQFNSAFRRTPLHNFLQGLHANELILCGMQTEYCMDATCKAAFELEYSITIPKGATTTFDNDFAKGEALARYYEDKIWDRRFARVIPVKELLDRIERTE